MKFWHLILIAFLLAACSTARPTPTAEPVEPPPLPNLGEAPELTNQVWLNTEQPLRLADLRGKVVLLEMWTFG